MGEIIIRVMDDIPVGIKAVTRLDCDGDYNIYLNGKLAHGVLLKALRHEMEHIYRDDWHSDLPLAQIESQVRMAVGE